MKKVIIVGGGISGLSLGYFLKKKGIPFTLLEKRSQVGGLIDRIDGGAYSFDLGPKTIRTKSSKLLLEMIEELGLQEHLLFSKEDAKKRFLFDGKGLEQVPDSLGKILTSKLTRDALGRVLLEPFKKCYEGDESIASFVERRLGRKILDRFFDPLLRGIYGGDCHELSIATTFASLKNLEREHGSILKGVLKAPKKKAEHKPALFSLEGGLKKLTEHLYLAIQENIHLGTEAKEIRYERGSYAVYSSEREYSAPILCLCLPLKEVRDLKKPFQSFSWQAFFNSMPTASITSVHIGYDKDLLHKTRGFGYLVPSYVDKDVMGAIFDSSIFHREAQTRLSVMLGGVGSHLLKNLSKQESIDLAKNALVKHLGITEKPDFVHVVRYIDAIAQPKIGHLTRLDHLEKDLADTFPGFYLAGNYLQGVGVADCVTRSFTIAEKL